MLIVTEFEELPVLKLYDGLRTTESDLVEVMTCVPMLRVLKYRLAPWYLVHRIDRNTDLYMKILNAVKAREGKVYLHLMIWDIRNGMFLDVPEKMLNVNKILLKMSVIARKHWQSMDEYADIW